MRAADDAIMAALRSAGLIVHDGEVPSQDNGTTVTSALPYVVFWSSLGPDAVQRLGGPVGALPDFQLTFVGQTREQAKWAGERAYAAAFTRSLAINGRNRRARLTDSQRVIVDKSVKVLLPNGSYVLPFYGVLQGSVPADR